MEVWPKHLKRHLLPPRSPSLFVCKGAESQLEWWAVRRAEELAEGGLTVLPPCWRSCETKQWHKRAKHQFGFNDCRRLRGGPPLTCTSTGKIIYWWSKFPGILCQIVFGCLRSLNFITFKIKKETMYNTCKVHHFFFFFQQVSLLCRLPQHQKALIYNTFLLYTATSSFVWHI